MSHAAMSTCRSIFIIIGFNIIHSNSSIYLAIRPFIQFINFYPTFLHFKKLQFINKIRYKIWKKLYSITPMLILTKVVEV